MTDDPDREPSHHPPPPLPHPPAHPPLDYGRPTRRKLPFVVQALFGFVAWFIAAAAFAGVAMSTSSNNGSMIVNAAVIGTVVVIAAAIALQFWLGWRGFLPGLLLGLLLTCLVPIGIVAYVCRGGLSLGHG